jgi:anti-anti-sigma factor
MWYCVTRHDDTYVLSVIGQIDLSVARELNDAFSECPGDVLVDLSGVTFMDSSGINTLVAARRAYSSAERQFTLQGISKNLLRTLETLGLVDYLGVDRSSIGPSS